MTGITVLASNNKGQYKNLIEVIDHQSDETSKTAVKAALDQHPTPAANNHTVCAHGSQSIDIDMATTCLCKGGCEVVPAAAGGFGVCSDLAVEQWFRFGAGAGGAANVPVGAMFVSDNGKLAFKDQHGTVHALY